MIYRYVCCAIIDTSVFSNLLPQGTFQPMRNSSRMMFYPISPRVFSSRLPPGEADTIPSTSSVRTVRVQKANDSFPYMVTHYQTTCFPSQKTILSSSPYQKICHKIVFFNEFVLFLFWPKFLNIKKMVHRLNHLGVGCLGFKRDPKV